jgi:hypothetical protein
MWRRNVATVVSRARLDAEAVFLCPAAALDALHERRKCIEMTKFNHQAEPRRFYCRPADRSFAAFKAFHQYITASLGITEDVTDDQLRQAWHSFWAAADGGEASGSDNGDSSKSRADAVEKFLLAHGCKPTKGVNGIGFVGGVAPWDREEGQ